MDWLDLPRKSNQNHAIIPCGRHVCILYLWGFSCCHSIMYKVVERYIWIHTLVSICTKHHIVLLFAWSGLFLISDFLIRMLEIFSTRVKMIRKTKANEGVKDFRIEKKGFY